MVVKKTSCLEKELVAKKMHPISISNKALILQ